MLQTQQLLASYVGCWSLAIWQIKGQAWGLASHNRKGYHSLRVSVRSGLIVRDGVCDSGLFQAKVLAPAWSLLRTCQPSLTSWHFMYWCCFCCHDPENKKLHVWDWGSCDHEDWNCDFLGCDTTRCNVCYQHFGGKCCFYLQRSAFQGNILLPSSVINI